MDKKKSWHPLGQRSSFKYFLHMSIFLTFLKIWAGLISVRGLETVMQIIIKKTGSISFALWLIQLVKLQEPCFN